MAHPLVPSTPLLSVLLAIGALVTAVATPLFGYLILRLKNKQELLIKKMDHDAEQRKLDREAQAEERNRMFRSEVEAREQVRKELRAGTEAQARAMDNLTKVGAATHEFLNSKEGAKLKRMAEKSRKLADHTKDESDIREAELDERLLRDHEEAQARVDAQPGTPEQKQGRG